MLGLLVEHIFLTTFYSLYYQKLENEKIISQIVRFSKGCDQIGDRVSKNDVSYHICISWLKCW